MNNIRLEINAGNDIVIQNKTNIGDTSLPRNGYFYGETSNDTDSDENDASEYDSNTPQKNSPDLSLVIFITGLASLLILAYLIIRYYSTGGEFFMKFGGAKGLIKTFPLYLKYDGHWFAMILAVLSGSAAKFIESISDAEENTLKSTGLWMGKAGVSIGLLFIVLALFANKIAGL